MGLIDFVKSAGEKIFGDAEKEAEEARRAAEQEAKLEELVARRRAAKLADLVNRLGLEVDELGVRVEGDVAIVGGKAATQEVREKVVLVVGNVDGIGRVDDQLEVAAGEAAAAYYTVKKGDTLSKIAKQHYGNAMKYPVIFEANRPMLTDPDRIYPGQVLRIPPVEG